jgi:hypothetical protein
MFHPSVCSPPFEDTTFETVEGSIIAEAKWNGIHVVESDNISYEVFYYMCNACQMSCHMPYSNGTHLYSQLLEP